jgi:hypothetical protein
MVVHSIIPATWEAKTGGSWFKVSLGKISTRPSLKNKLKTTRQEHCSNGRVLINLILRTAKKKSLFQYIRNTIDFYIDLLPIDFAKLSFTVQELILDALLFFI